MLVLTTVLVYQDHSKRVILLFFTSLIYCRNRSCIYKIVAAYGQLFYKAEAKGN